MPKNEGGVVLGAAMGRPIRNLLETSPTNNTVLHDKTNVGVS